MEKIKVSGLAGEHILINLNEQERNKALRDLLHEYQCEVTFTKVDGRVRVMPCTLKENVLPPVTEKEGKRTKAPNEANLSVWCTDKNEWRSFKVANVTEVKVLV